MSRYEEAKKIYEGLKAEAPCSIVAVAMDDLWFFTNGLTQDYGRK